MDILVPDRGLRHHSRDTTNPREARIWGLVAAASVLGMLFLIGAFEQGHRWQVSSSQPVVVQRAPAPLVPEPVPEPLLS